MQKKIIVTGANGQVGKELRELAKQQHGCQFIFLSREDLPLDNFNLQKELKIIYI